MLIIPEVATRGRANVLYELSEEEARLIEKYRDLLPKFQALADKMMDQIFGFQTAASKLEKNIE